MHSNSNKHLALVTETVSQHYIYRTANGYLRWIWYIAHQKIFRYPLQWYSSQWVDYNKVYPYWKKCTPTRKSLLLQREFSLFVGRVTLV